MGFDTLSMGLGFSSSAQGWQLDSSYWGVATANYTLEIIAPVEGLTTLNRWYKAYPGLSYNVRVAAVGGVYPYYHELITAPAGMTINQYTGEITWSNPTVSGSPHSVTIKITDQEGSTDTVSYTITVTTSGFGFVDAVSGLSVAQGGTGTIDNPWKSMADWYGPDENDNTYLNYFLYYRNGTYTIDTPLLIAVHPYITLDNKPKVWLAYPGESPVIDMVAAEIQSNASVYVDGFEVDNNSNDSGHCFELQGNISNVTFRKNKFHGITVGSAVNNVAFVTVSKSTVPGRNWVCQDNECYDVNDATNSYAFLFYDATHVLVENNIFHNVGGHPVGMKEGNQMYFVRGNYFYNNPLDSIWVQGPTTDSILTGNIEISYNLVMPDGGMIRVNPAGITTGDPIYIYRNTLLDRMFSLGTPTLTNGPWYVNNNVIVNENTSYPGGAVIEHVVILPADELTNVHISNNLSGVNADNICDDITGLLNPTYTSYRYTHNHELPSPWTALVPTI